MPCTTEDNQMDHTKKKNIRHYIRWIAMALVVILLAAMPLLARQGVEADGPVASILSTTPETGSIRTAIHSGGTLNAGDPQDVEVPKDVKILEFLVKNGDMVAQGDPLAAVDQVSVLTAITQIQDSMASVRKQMETYREEKGASSVPAAAGGRVKQVFAREGDRVESVILEHGALAVLSLDGKMCVKLDTPSHRSVGDSVTVTLADGKAVKGSVESNLNGTLTVVVKDQGYEVGQTVTVEGLGEGILEIHSPWAATAFTGKISAVKAKPEQVLSSGATLFTLTDTDYTAQRELLANIHREYEELLENLFRMYETGYIPAPCDGMISGIDKDSPHLLAAVEEEAVAVQPLTTANAGGFRLVLLGAGTPNCPYCNQPEDNHAPNCPHDCIRSNGSIECTAANHFLDCIKSCTHGDTDDECPATGAHYADCIKACVSAKDEHTCRATKHRLTCVESCKETGNIQDCPASRHKKTCIGACIHADTLHVCEASQYHYNDCIEACKNDPNSHSGCSATKHQENCFFRGMEYTGIAAKVFAAGENLTVAYDGSGIKAVVKTADGWAFADGSSPNETTMVKKVTVTEGAGKGFQKGDIILFVYGAKNGQQVWSDVVLYRKATPTTETPGLGGLDLGSLMGGMGGFGGMGSMYGASGSQSQLFDRNGDVLLSVTPQEEMTLTVSIDESDISKLALGMAAEITVNALPGETFTGTITHISQSGTGNGGSSKFAVELTLPHQSKMLSGMSASASILLSEKKDVLLLPAAAIAEEGGKTMVYTAMDKETGQPANPVEVTLGLSDGENVEILSGLRAGDPVYYAYYDTPEESDAVELNRIPMM